jgi:hypothetical protein
MTIDMIGNVGIGTSSPNDILHISKVAAATRLRVGNNGAYDASVYFNGNSDWSVGMDYSNSNAFTIGNSSALGTNTKFVIETGGNVGIGTETPNAKLTIKGDSQDHSVFSVNTGYSSNSSIFEVKQEGSDGMVYVRDANNNIITKLSGYLSAPSYFKSNLGIGIATVPNGYKLAVKGKIIAEELKIQLQSNWPDYVFAPNYKLPTLKEVEKHIKQKGHLQNIPSAKDVAKNGVFLGEMTKSLLLKIEELTLYTIQQEKEIVFSKKNNENLLLIIEQQSIQLKKIEKRLKKLEN